MTASQALTSNAGIEHDGDELEAVLNQREAEMDQNPSLEISHQEFLAHFAARRQA